MARIWGNFFCGLPAPERRPQAGLRWLGRRRGGQLRLRPQTRRLQPRP